MQIRYYTDVLSELKIEHKKLAILKNRKEELFVAICGVHSPSFDSESHGSGSNSNKVITYLHQLEEVKQDGLSLQQRIDLAEKTIQELEDLKVTIEEELKTDRSYSTQIYYEIVVNHKGRSEAVRCVADREYISERALWKRYFPRVRRELQKLKMVSESSVNDVR